MRTKWQNNEVDPYFKMAAAILKTVTPTLCRQDSGIGKEGIPIALGGTCRLRRVVVGEDTARPNVCAAATASGAQPGKGPARCGKASAQDEIPGTEWFCGFPGIVGEGGAGHMPGEHRG